MVFLNFLDLISKWAMVILFLTIIKSIKFSTAECRKMRLKWDKILFMTLAA